ncbi:MAG: glycosyltransferase family 4 protein, partial [Oceanidesulfovibrio sp.]
NMLTPSVMDELADTHGIEPYGKEPWNKSMTGGSDDHSGLHIARMHTEVPGARDLDSFFTGVARGDSEPRGRHASPKAFGHILYGIAYQFYRERFGLDRYVNKDRFCTFLDRSLSPDSPPPTLMDKAKAAIHNSGVLRRRSKRTEPEELRSILKTMAQQEFESRRDADPDSMRAAAEENEWFEFANATANRVLAHYGDRLMERVENADFFNIYKEFASAGVLYTLLSPFFVGFSVFTKDRAFCKQALSRFLDFHPGLQRPRKRVKIAHFTDTFFETNGVAKTLQEHVNLARTSNKEYAIVTCDDGTSRDLPGVLNFKPVGRYELPEYPELSLFYPPFLQMLTEVYEQGFTHIHSATPGPIGLAALGIARALKLPISGTYHTALPQYALHLTEDEGMEEFMWKAMVWYYNQMDYVYVPSDAVGQELRGKGVHPDKIRRYPRGVDVERFTPLKRNGFFKNFSLNGSKKLLYVGRISKEKNLHVLEEAYRQVAEQYPGKLDFVVVGDGPYREEMERNLVGTGAVFTGKLEGDDLSAAYASSDLFVFPSTTDTFGRVVLEAQASGIPVVVTDQGGPQENLLPGQTGLVVAGNDPGALKDAIVSLVSDPSRLKAMGKSARDYMETRSLSRCFDTTWTMYGEN